MWCISITSATSVYASFCKIWTQVAPLKYSVLRVPIHCFVLWHLFVVTIPDKYIRTFFTFFTYCSVTHKENVPNCLNHPQYILWEKQFCAFFLLQRWYIENLVNWVKFGVLICSQMIVWLRSPLKGNRQMYFVAMPLKDRGPLNLTPWTRYAAVCLM